MRFFEHQLEAQRASRRLLWLFVLAVLVMIVCTCLAAWGIWHLVMHGRPVPPFFHLTNALVITGLVVGGSIVELMRLKKGGSEVASMVGAYAIAGHTREHSEQQLINIVEELSVASGLPVPGIYVIPEVSQINAFAAGTHLRDACIVVTQGCLEHLSRDELQGVIAHEFSHIAHADMLINTRLAAALYGLLLVRMLGLRLLQDSGHAVVVARKRGSVGALLAPMGALLWASGSLGVWLGRLLRAAVSRHREYLADASAVRWTRTKHGLGGALRKILGQQTMPPQPRPNQPSPGQPKPDRLLEASEQLAHFYLSSPNQSTSRELLATHPPLRDRIKRIYGRTMGPVQTKPIEPDASISPSSAQPALADLPFVSLVDQVAAPLDWLDAWRIQIADPQSAMRAISTLMAGNVPEACLERVELALPILRTLPLADRRGWLAALRAEALDDHHLAPTEFVLLALLRSQLDTPPDRLHQGRASLKERRAAVEVVRCVLQLGDTTQHDLKSFEKALESLIDLRPLEKARLVKSLAEQSRYAHAGNSQLLHAVAALLDCPLPPASALC